MSKKTNNNHILVSTITHMFVFTKAFDLKAEA